MLEESVRRVDNHSMERKAVFKGAEKILAWNKRLENLRSKGNTSALVPCKSALLPGFLRILGRCYESF